MAPLSEEIEDQSFNFKNQKALLFNNTWIKHGNLLSKDHTNTTGHYLYIIEDLNVFRSKYDMYDRNNTQVDKSKAKNSDKVLIYF